MNFRYRLMQFMSGRNGTDTLNYGIIIVAAVLAFINILLRIPLLQIIVYTMIFYALFRAFSRNLSARSRENAWFVELLNTIRRKSEIQRQRRADIYHIYKKCPRCKAILRLPRRVGKHQTVCPKCNNQFTVRVRK